MKFAICFLLTALSYVCGFYNFINGNQLALGLPAISALTTIFYEGIYG